MGLDAMARHGTPAAASGDGSRLKAERGVSLAWESKDRMEGGASEEEQTFALAAVRQSPVPEAPISLSVGFPAMLDAIHRDGPRGVVDVVEGWVGEAGEDEGVREDDPRLGRPAVDFTDGRDVEVDDVVADQLVGGAEESQALLDRRVPWLVRVAPLLSGIRVLNSQAVEFGELWQEPVGFDVEDQSGQVTILSGVVDRGGSRRWRRRGA